MWLDRWQAIAPACDHLAEGFYMGWASRLVRYHGGCVSGGVAWGNAHSLTLLQDQLLQLQHAA